MCQSTIHACHFLVIFEKPSVASSARGFSGCAPMMRSRSSCRSRSTAGGNPMKYFLLGTVGLVALGIAAAPASAADLPAKPITKAPPPIPIYDWTGFYIGGNGGWGTQHRCFEALDLTGVSLGSEGCHNANG